MLPEFGGIELLAIAALALIVIGPKDLPVVLRKLGKFVGKMRGMAQEFRASFDELARQSELEELRKEVEAMRLAQSYDPTGLVPGAYGPQSGYDPAPPVEDHGVLPGSAFERAPEPVPMAEPAKATKTKAATKPAKPRKPATAKAAPAKATPAKANPKTRAPAAKPAKARKGTVQ